MEALPEDMLSQLTAIHDKSLILDEDEAAEAEDTILSPQGDLPEITKPKPRRNSILG